MPSFMSVEPDLWPALIQKLDQGVLVLDEQGLVVYANEEAGRLLQYSPDDLLGLDRHDLIALFQPERLDQARFASDLLNNQLSPRPDRTYAMATFSRRLVATPFWLAPDGIMVILLREDTAWPSALIVQAVMDELHSPLAFAIQYGEVLLNRLKDETVPAFELHDLARIMRDALRQALRLWQSLSHLHSATTQQTPALEMQAVAIPAAIRAAIHELKQRELQQMPRLLIELPGDLPLVRASISHLHIALSALLEGLLSRMSSQDQMTVSATDRMRYVQLELTPSAAGVLRGYLFDSLPLAITEQVITRHGGRIWIEAEKSQRPVLCLSLPVWEERASASSVTAHRAH